MKTTSKLLGIAMIAIITLALFSCGGDEPDPKKGDDTTPPPKTFTVTFDADNGSANTTQTVTEGSKANKPTPDPTKSGYNFGYWFNVANNTEWNFDTAVTADITLKAKWNEAPKARMENQPVQILTFTGATGTFSVTVKSADLYLDADWAVDVAKVVALIEKGFVHGNEHDVTEYKDVFAEGWGAEIILGKSFVYTWEVKENDYKKLYIKTSSINTITETSLSNAVCAMLYEYDDKLE